MNTLFKPVVAEIETVKWGDLSAVAEVAMLREDLIHPVISGNKYRKLKYNVQAAIENATDRLLTFGGAYSNHIAAVAAVGKETGFKTIGYIRGEEVSLVAGSNPTLTYAIDCGMQLRFIDREAYRKKETPEFIEQLRETEGEFYLIPEGGTNELAVQGCAEILSKEHQCFDYICVSVGTGGTMAGLLEAATPEQQIIGFSALKGTFQQKAIEKYTLNTNYQLIDSFCFGGYAKIDIALIRFINEFRHHTGIPLDPVYTGKMMFGITDLIKKGFFRKNSRILAIHTGGIQGIPGMNLRLKKKNLPQIEF